MTYESITVENMSPACGAIISDVDLAGGVTNQQFDEIHTALLDRTVIVFRDQALTETQHIEFTRRFGDLFFGGSAPPKRPNQLHVLSPGTCAGDHSSRVRLAVVGLRDKVGALEEESQGGA